MLRTAIAVSGLLLSTHLSATTFTVTRLDDPPPNGCLANDCSLREAVIAANATAAADIVQLGNGTHELTRVCVPDTQFCQDIDVTQPLTIRGNGSSLTEIISSIPLNASPLTTDRGHARVIEASSTLSLQNLRLRRGYSVSSNTYGGLGGCLLISQTTSALSNVVITDCGVLGGASSLSGGGAAISGGSSVWTAVTVSNSRAYQGGGVSVQGTLSGSNVVITGNRASTGGGVGMRAGAVMALGGGSRISTNTAEYAGGVYSAFATELRGERDSLLKIDHNLSESSCGGVTIFDVAPFGMTQNMLLRYLSLDSNVAKTHGGGICTHSAGSLPSGIVSILDSEIVNNSAGRDGGGIMITHTQAQQRTTIERVSLSRNIANRGAAVHASNGTLTMTNVSSHDNDSTTGAIHVLAGSAELTHVSSLDDNLSIDAGGTLRLRASVMSSNCAGNVQDGGFNFVRSGSAGCPGTPASSGALALAYDSYGGPYRIVGITSGTSPLREVVPPVLGATDARGWLRQNLHDVGAHEFDGVSP